MSEMTDKRDNIAAVNQQTIDDVIDEIGSRYAKDEYEEEILLAREEFDALRGKVFDDDTIFVDHMRMFLQWYVLERPLLNATLAPIYIDLKNDALNDMMLPSAIALAKSYRSLFEVTKVERDGLQLYDLIQSSYWWIPLDKVADGMDQNDIFETRILPISGVLHLCKTVMHHPKSAHDAIHRLIDERCKRKILDWRLVFEIAEMRLRYSRFRNIDVNHIYRARKTIEKKNDTSLSQ